MVVGPVLSVKGLFSTFNIDLLQKSGLTKFLDSSIMGLRVSYGTASQLHSLPEILEQPLKPLVSALEFLRVYLSAWLA